MGEAADDLGRGVLMVEEEAEDVRGARRRLYAFLSETAEREERRGRDEREEVVGGEDERAGVWGADDEGEEGTEKVEESGSRSSDGSGGGGRGCGLERE